MAYTITIEEVLNGITVTPPAANEVTVSTTNYPITISYNAVELPGVPGQGVPVGGTTGQVLTKINSTDYNTQWTTLTDLVGINNVVEDTTPQLGGNLDVNGNKIVSTANGNIVIEPNGTGDIELKADTVTYGDGGAYAYVTSTSGSILHFSGSGATNLSGNYFSVDDSSSTFAFQSTGSGTKMLFIADGMRLGKLGTEATITTNGSGGTLKLEPNVGSGNSGNITITEGVNQNISITPNGTGKIILDGLAWPNTDGVGNYVLKTNGSGVLSWSDVNSLVTNIGMTDIVQDTTPQLGGNLDVNAKEIVSVNNKDIILAPNGTGDIVLRHTDVLNGNGMVLVGPGTDQGIIASNGANSLLIQADPNNASGNANIILGVNGSIDITSTSAGKIYNKSNTTLFGVGNATARISSYSNRNLEIVTNDGTNSGSITINQGANANIAIAPNGTGKVVIDLHSWPNVDGTNSQVLSTNGSGVLSWVDKQDPTIVNDSQPAIQSTGQHWYRPLTGALYTARNSAWEPVNDDGYF